MADRSDDIKQLFSHLGLNPGDYRELREKLPQTVRAPAQAPAASRAAPKVDVTRAEPPTQVPPAQPGSSEPTAGPMTQRITPTVSVAAEPSQRWPLIRAAMESPTRVGQRGDSPATAAAPAQPRAAAPAGSQEVGALLKAAAAQVQAMSRPEADPAAQATRRLLLDQTRIMPTEAEKPVVPEVPMPTNLVIEPTGFESGDAVDEPDVAEVPPIELAPVPAVEVPAATVRPVPAQVVGPAAAQAVTAPVVINTPPPAEAPGESLQTTYVPTVAAEPGSELQSTFLRLADPRRQQQSRNSRLRFNYVASDAVPKPRKPKEENLGDVFSRISGAPKPR